MNHTIQSPDVHGPYGGALTGMFQKLRGQLNGMQDDALHKARDVARDADQVVHRHPYSAIGLAAAVGLVIGFLSTRR